jgi:hypothetical protein
MTDEEWRRSPWRMLWWSLVAAFVLLIALLILILSASLWAD